MAFDLELDRVRDQILRQKAKKVLIQLPDGLKPEAGRIADYLEENTEAEVLIWQASCYGACDTPEVKGIDLLVQFGHKRWHDDS
jgi:2-(3-amino-3-carboxypropyl)histidine synthase